MTDTRRRLMNAVAAEIIERERLARELAESAYLASQDDHAATAQMFRQLSRQKWIKGMELRGNLAVLRATDLKAVEGGD